MTIWIRAVALATALTGIAQTQPLVSPFAGSETLGEFSREFDRLFYAEPEGSEFKTATVEGKLSGHVYRSPEGKSPLEVLRSYENVLRQGGFEIVLSLSKDKGNVQNLVRSLYRSEGNSLQERGYTLGGERQSRIALDRLVTFAEHYLVARKSQADKTYNVAIVICRERGLYAVDVLESAPMETGTVTLSPELLKAKLDNEGRVAIYSIHFDTGSATIKPESEPALATIATYLNQSSGLKFYIVGHTDDTGTLDPNVQLSEQRANTVVGALEQRHGVADGRLLARGVGPLSPVSTNENNAGRALNRRVELVRRIQ